MYVSPRCRSHAPRGGALLRRSRRSRRPAARAFHASGRDISRSGATSFCPRRQKDAKTPPKIHGLWNSFTPNVIRRKRPIRNRLRSYPRCRFHVPRGGALLRRSRRSRRPAARSFHASGRDISRSGATFFCPRRQKDAKTPPKTHGLWNSFTPNVIRRKKAHKESPPRLSPLPLPRTARVACYDRLRDSAIRAAAVPTHRAAVPYCVGAGVPDGPLLVPFMPLAGIFRAPARHPFARGGKRMQKRRQRSMVFGIPLRRT